MMESKSIEVAATRPESSTLSEVRRSQLRHAARIICGVQSIRKSRVAIGADARRPEIRPIDSEAADSQIEIAERQLRRAQVQNYRRPRRCQELRRN